MTTRHTRICDACLMSREMHQTIMVNEAKGESVILCNLCLCRWLRRNPGALASMLKVEEYVRVAGDSDGRVRAIDLEITQFPGNEDEDKA